MRNSSIAVITFGYTSLAFEQHSDALHLMEILGKATQVTNDAWTHQKTTGLEYFLADSPSMPTMTYAAANKFCPDKTSKEATEAWNAAEAAKADLEQGVREIKPVEALAAPAPDTSYDENF